MHTRFDEVFRISIILKGLDALAEIIGGAILFFITTNTISRIGQDLTQHELKQDPHDWLANLILHSTHHLSAGSTRFGAIYLLSHGVVKIVVIIAVLMNKFWAYPLMLLLLAGFLVYQCLQLASHFTLGLTLLSAFDVFVAIMTAIEWDKQITIRRNQDKSAA